MKQNQVRTEQNRTRTELWNTLGMMVIGSENVVLSLNERKKCIEKMAKKRVRKKERKNTCSSTPYLERNLISLSSSSSMNPEAKEFTPFLSQIFVERMGEWREWESGEREKIRGENK